MAVDTYATFDANALRAFESGLNAAADALRRHARRFGDSLNDVARKLDIGIGQFERSAGKLEGAATSLQRAAARLEEAGRKAGKAENTGLQRARSTLDGLESAVVKLTGRMSDAHQDAARTGASASNTRAFAWTADAFDIPADQAVDNLERFRDSLANSLDTRNLLRDLGVEALDASGNLRETVDVLGELVPVLARLPKGETLGFDPALLAAMQSAAFAPELAGNRQRVHASGLDGTGGALTSFANIGHSGENILVGAASRVLTVLAPSLKMFSDWLRANEAMLAERLSEVFIGIGHALKMIVPLMVSAFDLFVAMDGATDGWSTRLIAVLALLLKLGGGGLLGNLLPGLTSVVNVIKRIGPFIKTFIGLVKTLGRWLGGALLRLLPLLGFLVKPLLILVAAVAGFLALFGAIVGVAKLLKWAAGLFDRSDEDVKIGRQAAQDGDWWTAATHLPIGEFITTAASALWDTVTTWLDGIVASVVQFVVDSATSLWHMAAKAVDGLVSLVDTAIASVKATVTDLWNLGVENVKRLMAFIEPVFEAIKGFLGGAWKKASEGAGKAAQAVSDGWDLMREGASVARNWVQGGISSWWGGDDSPTLQGVGEVPGAGFALGAPFGHPNGAAKACGPSQVSLTANTNIYVTGMFDPMAAASAVQQRQEQTNLLAVRQMQGALP